MKSRNSSNYYDKKLTESQRDRKKRKAFNYELALIGADNNRDEAQRIYKSLRKIDYKERKEKQKRTDWSLEFERQADELLKNIIVKEKNNDEE